MARGKQMKALEEMLSERRNQIVRLEVEIATLEMAIRRANGESDAPQRKRAPRSNVKSLVLELLEEVKGAGLNAGIAVEMGEKRGERIERGTVSSLLSRLKSDGAVTYDGTVYRLTKFSEPRRTDANEANASSATVVAHPSSRAAP